MNNNLDMRENNSFILHIKRHIWGAASIFFATIFIAIVYCFFIAAPVYQRTITMMMPMGYNDRDFNTIVQAMNLESKEENDKIVTIDRQVKSVRNTNLLQIKYEGTSLERLNEYSNQDINQVSQAINELNKKRYERDLLKEGILSNDSLNKTNDAIGDSKKIITEFINSDDQRDIYNAKIISDDNNGGKSVKPKRMIILLVSCIIGVIFASFWLFMLYIWKMPVKKKCK